MKSLAPIVNDDDVVTKGYVAEQTANKQNKLIGQEISVVAQDRIQIGNVVYAVKGNSIGSNPEGDIYANKGVTALNNYVASAAFSPDGSTLVLGGWFSGSAKVYSVDGTTITYVRDIYANAGTTAFDGDVSCVVFSPDGSTLVLCGWFSGNAKVYSVDGTTITYVGDIETPEVGYVNVAAFSPDGSMLVIGGSSNDYAWAGLYLVSGTQTTFIRDIYERSADEVMYMSITTISFSPKRNLLFLGGGDMHYACSKIYSISGTTVTYIGEIEDDGNEPVGYLISEAKFSPSGDALVIVGSFRKKAKVYSVVGTTIAFAGDLYADAGTTPFEEDVFAIAFSPDGSTLVLGAKIYNVNGTTITYVRDIYSGAGTTSFNDSIKVATFSPDGSTLVLGGGFSGNAKVYGLGYNAILAIKGQPNTDYKIGVSLSDIGVGNSGQITVIMSFNPTEFQPKSVIITLRAASWNKTTKTQTVSVSGVTASNAITPCPAPASGAAAGAAGVLCTAQAANSLTFTCTTVPTVDLIYNVLIQEIQIAIITFSIDGTPYQAEEGMTWEQWIGSAHNTIGCNLFRDVPVVGGTAIKTPNWTDVFKTDVIIPNTAYVFSQEPSVS